MTFQIVNIHHHNVTNVTMYAKYAQCEIVDPGAYPGTRQALKYLQKTNMQEYANLYINQ